MTTAKTGKMKSASSVIKVENLARVEGEGGLYVKIRNNVIQDVQLKIFEPPRFFEAFLRGRRFNEAPDITARICGICPIAYQMSASHAMEDAIGISIPQEIRSFRRLIYCGEWIQSHVLHVFLLHAPDFLGYQSAIHMAKDYPEEVKTALSLKKLGNDIMELMGGRAIHPINLTVGGFFKLPTRKQLDELKNKLEWGRTTALKLTRLVAGFTFPDFQRDYEYVALHHPDEYAITEGRLISNRGLDIALNEYEHHFEEIHVEHSNALHSVLKARGAYFVGPLARFNLNFGQLSPLAKQIAQEVNCLPPCNNPFKSIIVRMIETVYAFDEAIRIIDETGIPEQPRIEVTPKAGTGYGCTEAPRGICWHKYSIDEHGIIQFARIVPPTSQNQKTIEEDLREYVARYIDLPKDDLTWQCEQAIRNYDPCISCATHFLKLNIDRE